MDQDVEASNLKILIGATGSIHSALLPAYLNYFEREVPNVEISIVVTHSCTRIIPVLTLSAYCHGRVFGPDNDVTEEGVPRHIDLAGWPDEILVLPASANTIRKIAQGSAEDLLSAIVLASTARVTLAPAMSFNMWNSAATRENIERIRKFGLHVLESTSSLPVSNENAKPGVAPTPRVVIRYINSRLYENQQARAFLYGVRKV